MIKEKYHNAVLCMAGLAIGIAMQYAPHLQGQWGQNIITYMASDLGCWAVISILIATYAETPVISGKKNFLFMTFMVMGYYLINLESIRWNIRWIVLAFLMFPIGVAAYWYRKKIGMFIVFEGIMAIFLMHQILTFYFKISNNLMIVYDENGVSVFMNQTFYSLANYSILILATIFTMIFMLLKYYKESKNLSST